MDYSFLSLIPPVIVILAGYITRRVIFSISLGIFCSALIAAQFNFYNCLNLTIEAFSTVLEVRQVACMDTWSSLSNSLICIFLFF